MTALPLADLLGGGSIGRMLQYAAISQSRSTVIQFDGLLDVLAIAGHGSGGIAGGAAAGGNQYVTGASTGELAIALRIPVKRGEIVTSTIGAGGAAVSGGTVKINGNDGGSTTVVLPGGRTIVVNPGKGAITGNTLPLNGPRGGYGGTGGDLHIEGGPGGSILATSSPHAAAGSGAVGLLLTPPAERAGGNVNAPGANAIYSGGAGVGGRGGHCLASVSGQSMGPSGGGAGGPGTDITVASQVPSTAGPNMLGEQAAASPTALVQSMASFWGLDYFGGGGRLSRVAGPGGGGSAVYGVNAEAASGMFAGPGGSVANTALTAGVCAGNGPGGSACNMNNSVVITSTPGHPGLVILVVREG